MNFDPAYSHWSPVGLLVSAVSVLDGKLLAGVDLGVRASVLPVLPLLPGSAQRQPSTLKSLHKSLDPKPLTLRP